MTELDKNLIEKIVKEEGFTTVKAVRDFFEYYVIGNGNLDDDFSENTRGWVAKARKVSQWKKIYKELSDELISSMLATEERVDEVVTDIISYYAGSELPESYSDEQKEIIARKEKEWFNLPCDSEGTSKGQEAEQDKFLEELAKQVLKTK